MAADRLTQRIVIVGASSLLGAEVKTVLEESRFAGWDLRLVDEENAAGTLTAAGGEAAVIQRIEEDTFHGARFAFLTGSAEFAKQCFGPAKEAGATILDFSGASLETGAAPWFPKIESLTKKAISKQTGVYSVLSAAGTAIGGLALALQAAGLQRLVTVLFQPVSEAGREGIEELETQTSQLLSFQPVGEQVFGTQAAFNLLPKYGEESRQDLTEALQRTRAELSAVLRGFGLHQSVLVNLIHAPVFYGLTFSTCAFLAERTDVTAIKQLCKDAGFVFVEGEEPGPSNVSVAGETNVLLRDAESDSGAPGAWWLWGGADNLRLPAWNGCKLAEWLES
jgi:aspartate-semialdehyde dehydrogenase